MSAMIWPSRRPAVLDLLFLLPIAVVAYVLFGRRLTQWYVLQRIKKKPNYGERRYIEQRLLELTKENYEFERLNAKGNVIFSVSRIRSDVLQIEFFDVFIKEYDEETDVLIRMKCFTLSPSTIEIPTITSAVSLETESIDMSIRSENLRYLRDEDIKEIKKALNSGLSVKLG